MIRFYYHPSPNPAKVALFLEGPGLPYELAPLDTCKGEQFDPAFRAVNPNAKIPAITDGDVTMFNSNLILLYLAGEAGQILPPDAPAMPNLKRLFDEVGARTAIALGEHLAFKAEMDDEARRNMVRHIGAAAPGT